MTLSGLRSLGPWLLVPLLVTGCPLTDDYFIDDGRAVSGSASTGGTTSGLPMGGAPDWGGGTSGSGAETSSGGVGESGAGPAQAEAGAASATCTPTTERCNGYDDNCNEMVDERACNSMAAGTFGCYGFVIASRPDHGYMLCVGEPLDYARAQEACRAQGMRLAWLESAAENEAVSVKVNATQAGLEAWLGGTDQETEEVWGWDGQGGFLFWGGNQAGNPVGGAYVAWAEETPNNSQEGGPMGEDCAVLMSASARWGDRTCTIKYAYLCEEPEPLPQTP